MASTKSKYNVYKKYVDMSDNEDGYHSGANELWEWQGSSFAVSEAKALNNVQFRIHGDGGHSHGRNRVIATVHTAAIPQWICVKQFSKCDKMIYESIKNKEVLPLSEILKVKEANNG